MRIVHALLVTVTSLSGWLRAQIEIATVFADPPYRSMGGQLAGIGDGDGDGVPDFIVRSEHFAPGFGDSRVQLISGASLTVLGQVVQPSTSFGLSILCGAGDLNLDGNNEFLASNGSQLSAYRGDNATLLWTNNSFVQGFSTACSISDINSDGRADVAACVSINGNSFLVILSGFNGTQIGGLAAVPQHADGITSLGNVNVTAGDEVVLHGGGYVQIFDTTTMQLLGNVPTPSNTYSQVGAANVDGDARKELLISDSQVLLVYSPVLGQIIATYPMQYSAFTVLGDLNSDGFDDLAVRDNQSRHGYSADPSVSFISGATGAYLANWSHTFEFFGRELVGVGDVDGDGFGDLLLGDSFAKPIGGNADGGWQLVSGRILATTYQIPVQCHGGPFPPDLGMSRPIIGQSAVLVGRDGPANAWGVLALSPRPEFPVSLGFSGCYAWFDTSNWIVAHLAAPAAQWTFSLPVPNVPQLAGVDVALQSFYVPSNSPIGLDLSNAIWARIGF